jgi:Zn-dependent alcohol dehydrogenase
LSIEIQTVVDTDIPFEEAALLCQWIRENKLKTADFVTHCFLVEQINSALEIGKTGQIIKCLLMH